MFKFYVPLRPKATDVSLQRRSFLDHHFALPLHFHYHLIPLEGDQGQLPMRTML